MYSMFKFFFPISTSKYQIIDKPATFKSTSFIVYYMTFEIMLRSHIPVNSDSLEDVLEQFLLDIGYLSGRKRGQELHDSIPFRLWTECLLKDPEKPRTADELAAILDSSKPTIYRHLNKLKKLDLLESEEVVEWDDGEVTKKGYRLRHGDFNTAWHVTEANIESTKKRYRETVDKIVKLTGGMKE